jgi:polyvinyl alcohol dehydrogenase (cytochrome)
MKVSLPDTAGTSRIDTRQRPRGWPVLTYAVLYCMSLLASPLTSAASDAGEALYLEHCSECHEGNVPRAPHNILFRMSQPRDILAAMNDGPMRQQASTLTAQERQQVANYLAGTDDNYVADTTMTQCPSTQAGASSSSTMTSWGMDLRNTRFMDTGTAGITRDNVAKLQLKWVFDYPGATRARSQPAVYGGTVFVGSQRGSVYAIDLASGCMHWSYQADAEVRSAVSIDPGDDGKSITLYFGDFAGNVYALDGADGTERWRSHLNDHPDATITGSPRLHAGRLFVPMSSREWATAADPNYSCCTFRGGISAFDAVTGKLIWKAYSIPETPADTGKRNPLGVAIMGPSGAPVWNSPTIDEKRGLLYVGTGESYTSPAAATSDAVLAISLTSGEIVWSRQLTAGDAWNMSCFIGSSYNCPEENGPDMDIGAPPILVTLESGKDILVVGQKNGVVHGLDPDSKGAIVWQRKIGLGGYAGGIHWGMAADGSTVFAPNADTDFIGRFQAPRYPGLFALDAKNGEQHWYTRAEADCREDQKPACDAGISAAATAIPGLVFTGAFDGQLRAYNSNNGSVLWSFQTNTNFESVSGRAAHGGSIESDGPVIAGGYLLVNSGYLYGSRMPGNVLLAFSLPESEKSATEGGK